MRRKCFIMASVSFVIAIAIYVFTYYLYHYIGADGSFGVVYHSEPAKPFITFCFGVWGVMHQFAAGMSFIIGIIFFPKEYEKG